MVGNKVAMVPLVMAVLWYKEILPGPLALAFSISDFGSFLWTFAAAKRSRAGECDSAFP